MQIYRQKTEQPISLAGGQPLQSTPFYLEPPHLMETITFTFSKTSQGQSSCALQRRLVFFQFSTKHFHFLKNVKFPFRLVQWPSFGRSRPTWTRLTAGAGWRLVFCLLENKKSIWNLKQNLPIKHLKHKPKQGPQNRSGHQILMSQNSLRVMVTRHPFERLASVIMNIRYNNNHHKGWLIIIIMIMMMMKIIITNDNNNNNRHPFERLASLYNFMLQRSLLSRDHLEGIAVMSWK